MSGATVEPEHRIADAVAQILGESGLSKTKFARAAGVDKATIDRILDSSVQQPHEATLSKIAKASGREWDALLKVLDGEPLPPPTSRDGSLGDRLAAVEQLLYQQGRLLEELADEIRKQRADDDPR
jgi:transcriptional regulator with XRE-family HTH domain